MRKSTAILGMVAALLVGVAVTVYAQTITWRKVTLQWDDTTQVAALGNKTAWDYTWRVLADMRGIDKRTCDAACRKALVGQAAREALNQEIAQSVRRSLSAGADEQAGQIAAAVAGALE